MSNKMLKQILVAHPAKFTTQAIKTFLNQNDVHTYILDDLNDFNYLIEDLKPEVILVHESYVNDEFKAQIHGHDLKLVVIKIENSSFSDDSINLFIQEPQEISELYSTLQSFLD